MKGSPTILLTNDDGIHSRGLLMLKRRLDELGRVVVVAPEGERSGIGKALTIDSPIRVLRTRLADGSTAYAVTGTPADAVLLSLHKILNRPPSLLVSGINLGPNLGVDDFLNSGTLGACLEAAVHGVSSIAVSYAIRNLNLDDKRRFVGRREDLELAASIACEVVRYVLREGMPQNVDIISINVPENADPRRIRVTSLSYLGYGDIYRREGEGFRIMGWHLSDYPEDQPGTDLHAVREGWISITPIKVRMIHNLEGMERLLHFLRLRLAQQPTK